jgi:hypothetical protein
MRGVSRGVLSFFEAITVLFDLYVSFQDTHNACFHQLLCSFHSV